MSVYIVFEYKEWDGAAEIVCIFSNEKDAKEYVQKNFWKDEVGYDGIYYEKHEVK